MKIVLASEVCSFNLMKIVKQHLIDQGHEVVDVGMQDPEHPDVFYNTARKVAETIQRGEAERGLLMCGTGNGVCNVASKFKGVYPGLAESATTARLHWVINRCNVLCMGAWVVGERVACDMADAWLNAKIGEGFNEVRRKVQADGFEKLKAIEAENFK
jgi:ribose 5-phosphate isomerase B